MPSMSLSVSTPRCIVMMFMMLLLPIIWGHADSSVFFRRTLKKEKNVDNDGECPHGRDLESVLYDFKLFVLHEATVCDKKQRNQIREQLNQLLNTVLQTVPDLISAETSLCPTRQQLHFDPTTTTNNTDGFEPPERSLSDWNHQQRVTESVKMMDDAEEIKYELNPRNLFIYRGGMRCQFCLSDDWDDRRHLVNENQDEHEEEQQCNHGWTILLRSKKRKHGWDGWSNTRQSSPLLRNCGQHVDNCVGPYKSGETLSKIITVPKKTIILRVQLIVRHVYGAPWENGDEIIFRLGNDLLIQVPILLVNDVHRLRSKEYSVIVKHIWSQDGTTIISTILRLHFHTLEIFSKPYRANKIEFAISSKLKSSGGGQEKAAVFKGLTIKFAQTCGRILPMGLDRKKRNERIRQWELRQFVEALLSFRMTGRFRRLIRRSEDHCLRQTRPFIFLHLKKIEEDNGAPLECRA